MSVLAEYQQLKRRCQLVDLQSLHLCQLLCRLRWTRQLGLGQLLAAEVAYIVGAVYASI